MPTLYVENVPKDLYEALRAQAKARKMSISAEVIELLKQHVPTKKQLAAREEFWRLAMRLRREGPLTPGPFPTTEEMLREDRDR
jgi:plasmid stability protein